MAEIFTLAAIAVLSLISAACLLYGLIFFGKPNQPVVFYTRTGRVHADELAGLIGLCGSFGCAGALAASSIWEIICLV